MRRDFLPPGSGGDDDAGVLGSPSDTGVKLADAEVPEPRKRMSQGKSVIATYDLGDAPVGLSNGRRETDEFQDQIGVLRDVSGRGLPQMVRWVALPGVARIPRSSRRYEIKSGSSSCSSPSCWPEALTVYAR